MPIDLTETPASEPLGGDPATRLAALRSSLAALQLRQTAHRRRLLLIVEGWEATGKRALMRQVLASLDPCSTEVHCSGVAPIRRDRQHWLAEYWGRLPSAGHSTIFYRSWYRRLVEERVQRAMADDPFSRGCDEVNEFEAQQGDHDTMVIKFFFDVPREVQAERLAERAADPWKRLLTQHDAPHARERRDDYRATWNNIFAQTDTRWAPWSLIDGSEKQGARIAALRTIADRLEKALPSEPPREAATIVDFPSKAQR